MRMPWGTSTTGGGMPAQAPALGSTTGFSQLQGANTVATPGTASPLATTEALPLISNPAASPLGSQPGVQATMPLTGPDIDPTATGRYGQTVRGAPANFLKEEPAALEVSPSATPMPYFSAVLLTTLVPWWTFALVSVVFILFYQMSPPLVWLVLFLLGALILISVLGSARGRKYDRAFLFILMEAALIGGAVAGFFNYHRNVQLYMNADRYQEYTNVLPDDPATAHADAALLVFSTDSKVDITRPTMFKAGDDYCVAPIVSSTHRSEIIQYWAIGKNCCTSRSGFQCDDSMISKARGGVVVRQDSNRLVTHDHEFFLEAMQMSAKAYGLIVAPSPIMVRWVWDIEAALSSYFWAAWRHWLLCACSAFVVIFVVSCFGAFALPRNELVQDDQPLIGNGKL